MGARPTLSSDPTRPNPKSRPGKQGSGRPWGRKEPTFPLPGPGMPSSDPNLTPSKCLIFNRIVAPETREPTPIGCGL